MQTLSASPPHLKALQLNTPGWHSVILFQLLGLTSSVRHLIISSSHLGWPSHQTIEHALYELNLCACMPTSPSCGSYLGRLTHYRSWSSQCFVPERCWKLFWACLLEHLCFISTHCALFIRSVMKLIIQSNLKSLLPIVPAWASPCCISTLVFPPSFHPPSLGHLALVQGA